MTTLPCARRHLLAPDATTARTARLLVTELVQPVLPPAAVERIVLLTSEVVTNALLHARPPYVLDVRVDEGVARVMVHDASPEVPRPRDRRLHHAGSVHAAPASDAPTGEACGAIGGWGLVLVREMADAWGSETTPDGKVVWFEVACPTTVAGD